MVFFKHQYLGLYCWILLFLACFCFTSTMNVFWEKSNMSVFVSSLMLMFNSKQNNSVYLHHIIVSTFPFNLASNDNLNYQLLPAIDTKYHENPLMGVLFSGNIEINIMMETLLVSKPRSKGSESLKVSH